VIRTSNLWVRPGAPSPFSDERRIEVGSYGANGFFIDLDITLRALEDVRIERTNHALFSARMAPDLAVNDVGHLVNAEGKSGEKATFGVRSAWMSAYGDRNGAPEGLAILTHPSNRFHPSRWFTRDYGFFSPSPLYWIEGGELRQARGETLRLRYRVLAHEGDPTTAGVAAEWKRWCLATSGERK